MRERASFKEAGSLPARRTAPLALDFWNHSWLDQPFNGLWFPDFRSFQPPLQESAPCILENRSDWNEF